MAKTMGECGLTEIYEQQSVMRALCTGNCGHELAPDEVYACSECVSEWLVYCDPNGDMTDGEFTQ